MCARRNRSIHPVTWPAFFRPVKTNALDFEILIDQIVEIGAARNNISSRQRRRRIVHVERVAKFIEHVERKERDLAFVIVFKIEVAIAANAATSHTLDRRDFDRRILVGLAPVMSDEVMSN